MTRLDLKRRALAEVNTIRSLFGWESLTRFPRGMVGEGEHCVIANCFPKASAGYTSLTITKEDGTTVTFINPRNITRFITAFDAKRYPALIQR